MTRISPRVAAISLVCATATSCHSYTPAPNPRVSSEVRVRLSPPRDLRSVSASGDTTLLPHVRVLQAHIRGVDGDTLEVIAPGDYTGARGNFLLDAGRSVRIVREDGVIVERVRRDVVNTTLATGVVMLTALVVYVWWAMLNSWE